VSLTAGNGEQSTLLYFLLVPKEALDHRLLPLLERWFNLPQLRQEIVVASLTMRKS
jgi:hypothetical protein